MKYIMIMQFPFGLWKSESIEHWPPEDIQAHINFLNRFNKELSDAGELVGIEALVGPDQAKLIKAKPDGKFTVTDGPFAESKEFLAGYWIIDVDTPERAYELAGRASAAPGPGGKPFEYANRSETGDEWPGGFMKVDYEIELLSHWFGAKV